VTLSSFDDWVKESFTDWDKLLPGDSICSDCLFWFDEASEALMQRVGKDKPQKMRNYSHFIVNGDWIPCSKADKARMKALLTGTPFPELAVVAVSGQKHLVFRARWNPPGGKAGWIQFEELSFGVDSQILSYWLVRLEDALGVFSKGELESGHYQPFHIMKYGLQDWQALEAALKPQRGSPLLALAIFLAQRRSKDDDEPNDVDNGRSEAESGNPADDHLAGHSGRLQEPLSADDLGTIRERGGVSGLHESSGAVHQLPLWPA
jgi:hypothetical protein